MTVEEIRGSLDLTDNGAIRNSIRNCVTVLQNDPNLKDAIRYNMLTERCDIVKPLWWNKPTATLTDTDLDYLMLYLEDKYSLTSEKKIEKAISIVADSNQYHPIRDFLNSLEWTAQNVFVMLCLIFWGQKIVSIQANACGCLCWALSTECSIRDANSRSCSVW